MHSRPLGKSQTQLNNEHIFNKTLKCNVHSTKLFQLLGTSSSSPIAERHPGLHWEFFPNFLLWRLKFLSQKAYILKVAASALSQKTRLMQMHATFTIYSFDFRSGFLLHGNA